MQVYTEETYQRVVEILGDDMAVGLLAAALSVGGASADAMAIYVTAIALCIAGEGETVIEWPCREHGSHTATALEVVQRHGLELFAGLGDDVLILPMGPILNV